MSSCREEIVTCPHCGQESKYRLWNSVNTALNPELKQKILSKELFLFQCPECGEKMIVDYGMLYHQTEDKLMIYYVTDDNEFTDVVGKLAGRNIDDRDEEYRCRVVCSSDELAEKIMIFDAGLDDRAVELLKLLCRKQMEDGYPEMMVDDVYFQTTEDSQGMIVFLSQGQPCAEIPFKKEAYDAIQKYYKEEGNDELIIDMEWAYGVLTSMEN